MTEPKKTTRAYRVNQPRPAGLPEYISTEAWERLRALPTSLCATLVLEFVGDALRMVHVSADGHDLIAQTYVDGEPWSVTPDSHIAWCVDQLAPVSPTAPTEPAPEIKVVPTPKKKRPKE